MDGVAAHPSPVGVDGRRHRRVGLGGLHRVLPGRHHQAGRQARHVPFERAGQRLVEVAQVEVEVALGRGPQPVVQDVGVAAELDLDPAVRPRGQVRRHDRGGAAVVVPRGQRHALVPQRDQLGQPDVVLGRDGLEGVVPPGALVPVADALPRRQDPGLPPCLPALGGRGRQVVPRCDGCGCHQGLAHGARPLWVRYGLASPHRPVNGRAGPGPAAGRRDAAIPDSWPSEFLGAADAVAVVGWTRTRPGAAGRERRGRPPGGPPTTIADRVRAHHDACPVPCTAAVPGRDERRASRTAWRSRSSASAAGDMRNTTFCAASSAVAAR